MVEAKARLINQLGPESVHFARCQTAGIVLAIAVLKAAAIEHGLERRGQEIVGVAEAEAREEVIFLTECLVDADIEPVVGFTPLRFGEEVSTRAQRRRKVGTRRREVSVGDEVGGDAIELESGIPGIRPNDIGRYAANHGRGRSAAGSTGVRRGGSYLPRVEDLAVVRRVSEAINNTGHGPCVAGRIVREKRGKISACLGCSWNGCELRECLADARALVVSEKERLVLYDRATEGESKLVLLVRHLAENVESIVGVKFFVPQEFKNVAVKLIGAGLDDGIHDGAVAASEFGAVRIRFHLEFGDGIYRRLHHIGGAVEHVAQIGVVVNAVEQEIVLQGARAVGAETRAGFHARARFSRRHPRSEQSELSVIASVQGERVDAPALHQLTEFGGIGFELRPLGGHLDHLGGHARLKLQVHTDAILDVHLNGAGDGLLESLLLYGDTVTADVERAGYIFSLIVGGEADLNAAVHVGHGDFRIRYHRAALIADQAYNGTSIFLRG